MIFPCTAMAWTCDVFCSCRVMYPNFHVRFTTHESKHVSHNARMYVMGVSLDP